MIFKIQSDKLLSCDKYGNIQRQICDSVLNANFSEKQNMFVITRINGLVETRDVYGNSIRKICEGGQDAKFIDSNILVRLKSENRLIDKYGNVIRRM